MLGVFAGEVYRRTEYGGYRDAPLHLSVQLILDTGVCQQNSIRSFLLTVFASGVVEHISFRLGYDDVVTEGKTDARPD